MNWFVDLFSEDKTIQAFANLFGLIAGIVVLWTLSKFLWVFFLSLYRNNLAVAWRRLKNQDIKFAISSAQDIHLYLSRIALYLFSIIVSCTGLLTTVISANTRNSLNVRERFADQSLFSDFEHYRKFTEVFERSGSISLMILFLLSAFMFMTHVRQVRHLRYRWRRRKSNI